MAPLEGSSVTPQ